VTVDSIEHEFKRKVTERIRLVPEGIDRFRVLTPFRFDDGDHLAVVLKREGNRWLLSDEGHTYMHLTYDIDERDLQRGTRQKVITGALEAFSVQDREGELVLTIPDAAYGDALYSFLQALLKVTDVTFLARETVRSLFMEDFRAFMEEHVPAPRRAFDWHDPSFDRRGLYTVDCRINGMARPLFVYALPSDDKARDATIALHEFERWNIEHRSLGIFEDQESINRKVLARFTDVVDKAYSSLESNRERIAQYLSEMVGD